MFCVDDQRSSPPAPEAGALISENLKFLKFIIKYLFVLLISQYKIKFQSFLKDVYPSVEINSFFNLLAEDYLGVSRLDIALNNQKELSPSEENKFEEAASRLHNQEPIQYIIGETEFYGLKFKVSPEVLIPRPETEELVEWILNDLKFDENKEISILDFGTGSGCIAVSLAKNIPRAKVSAMDISSEVLKVAEFNAQKNNVDVNFIQQDILKLKSLSQEFDLIVSNPPYVREMEKKEMHPNVLNFEPSLALYVKDEDPLIFYRKITKLAKEGLKRNGRLFFEANQYLADDTCDILKQMSFETELRKDIYGNLRMLKGIKN